MRSRIYLLAGLAAALLCASAASLRAQTFTATTATIPLNLEGQAGAIELLREPLRQRGSFRFGLGPDVSYYPSFTTVTGNQLNLRSFSGDNKAWGISAFGEYQPREPCPLVFGVGARYNKLRYTQTYSPTTGGYPDRVDGTLGGTFVDFYSGYGRSSGRYGWKGTAGFLWAFDQLVFGEFFGDLERRKTRSLSAWKGSFGVDYDFPLLGDFDGRVRADYTTSFKGGDADANARFGFYFTRKVPNF